MMGAEGDPEDVDGDAEGDAAGDGDEDSSSDWEADVDLAKAGGVMRRGRACDWGRARGIRLFQC